MFNIGISFVVEHVELSKDVVHRHVLIDGTQDSISISQLQLHLSEV